MYSLLDIVSNTIQNVKRNIESWQLSQFVFFIRIIYNRTGLIVRTHSLFLHVVTTYNNQHQTGYTPIQSKALFNSWNLNAKIVFNKPMKYCQTLTSVFQCPWLFPTEDPVENAGVHHAAVEAKVIVKRRPDVSNRMKFLPNPWFL